MPKKPTELAQAYALFETNREAMIAYWRDPRNPPSYRVQVPTPTPTLSLKAEPMPTNAVINTVTFRLRVTPDRNRWAIVLESDERVIFARGVHGDTFGLGGGGW